MQTFEQVKDVLDYSKTIHARLRKLYASMNEQPQQERVKMLLEYLYEQEHQLEQATASFEAVTPQSILDTWVQYGPSFNMRELIDSKKIRPDMSFDEVVDLAMEFDDALTDFYKQAENESDIPRIKEIFQNLVEMERRGKIRQLRAAFSQDM
jgi:rubrerythrin